MFMISIYVRCTKKLGYQDPWRGPYQLYDALRTSAALEVDFFVIIVYSFKPLTLSIENSVLDDLGVLDPPLITSALSMMSNKLIFCRVFKYKSSDVVDLQLPESRS